MRSRAGALGFAGRVWQVLRPMARFQADGESLILARSGRRPLTSAPSPLALELPVVDPWWTGFPTSERKALLLSHLVAIHALLMIGIAPWLSTIYRKRTIPLRIGSAPSGLSCYSPFGSQVELTQWRLAGARSNPAWERSSSRRRQSRQEVF